MPILEIRSAGLMTTVQDHGRYGYAHLGVSAAGAADPWSFRIGNLLVGNNETAASLEMTLTGAEIVFEEAAVIALTGADMGPLLDGAAFPMWTAVEVRGGQTLACGAAASGARTYLAIAGSIQVPLVFGSSSTHVRTGIGGYSGRALRKGDRVRVGAGSTSASRAGFFLRAEFRDFFQPPKEFRVTLGPQARLFGKDGVDLFCSARFEVKNESDRMGLRCGGETRIIAQRQSEIFTEGVSLGAVQITHDGNPIILFVDHQTTGGYPKISNVIAADLHGLGQLRPGDMISFTEISMQSAHALLAGQESLLRRELFERS
jgi:antagonist of KipI